MRLKTVSNSRHAGTPAMLPLRRTQAISHVELQRRLVALASTDEAEVAVDNYGGTGYAATLTLDGSSFTVLLDTGSSDLWVSCYYVDGGGCSQECPSTKQASSTISYGSGDVCVLDTTATLSLGGVQVDSYGLGIATGSNVVPGSANILPNMAQGLLGLAYPALATIPTPAGQFIDYVQSFSMFLTGDDGADGSFLLLNAVDEDLIAANKLVKVTVPLKDASYWMLGLTAFQVGDDAAVQPCANPSSDGSCNAIIDTGTSLLLMPTTQFKSFVDTHLTPNGCATSRLVASNSVYVCDKDIDLPRLSFSFQDATFFLSKEDYGYSLTDTQIIIEIQSTSAVLGRDEMWVIGDTFLKSFYTQYTVNESVAFYCQEGVTCGQYDGSLASDGDLGLPSANENNKNSNGEDGGGGLATGWIVLIAVAGLALLIAALWAIQRCCRRSPRTDAAASSPVYVTAASLTPAGAATTTTTHVQSAV